MTYRQALIASLLALSLGGRTPQATAAYAYSMTIIQSPGCGIFGPDDVIVAGLNEQGHVTGAIRYCQDAPSHAFIWTPEAGLTVLDPVPGSTYSSGTAVNVHDELVGDWDGSTAASGYTGLWWNGALPLDLPPGVGGTNSLAFAINDASVVVGEWGNTQIGPYPKPCMWTEGRLVDLSASFAAPLGSAAGINCFGDIVGWRGTSWVFDSHACILQSDGQLLKLDELAASFATVAEDVNRFGHVAGWTAIGQFGNSQTRALLWRGGELTVIDPLPGFTRIAALAISDVGHVVGQVWAGGLTGFLWNEGALVDLKTFVPPGSPIKISSAVAVNAAGQILCQGGPGDHAVGILFSPIDPIPGDVNYDYAVDEDDLGLVLACWDTDTGWADLNDDGIVSGMDLGILLANWSGVR